MKKCPQCSAQLKDNARFCVYCMTTLEPKKAVTSLKTNNRGWQVLLAALLVFTIVLVSLFLADGKKPSPSMSSGFSQNETSYFNAETSFFNSTISTAPMQNQSDTNLSSLYSSLSHYSSSNKASISTSGSQSQNTVTSFVPTSSYISNSASTYVSSYTSTSSKYLPITNSSSASISTHSSASTSNSASTTPSTTNSTSSKASTIIETKDYFKYSISNNRVSIIKGINIPSGADVIIPNTIDGYPVIGIANEAFDECPRFASVTIPETVTHIGNFAFSNGVSSVYLTNLAAWTGISIGYNSYSCPLRDADLYLNGELVTHLVIPDGVERIAWMAFSGCKSIKSVYLPKSVTYIGEHAFESCEIFNVYYEGSISDRGNIIGYTELPGFANWHYNS